MNKLEQLWQSIFDRKTKLAKEQLDKRIGFTKGFLGQRYSETRQMKNHMMRSMHLRTGKAYRKYLKAVRRENKADAERLAMNG